MGQRKIGIQFHRGLKMSDRGIGLSLREQDPAQRVVPLGTLRREPHNFFEIRPRRNQIAFLQRRHALLIDGIRPRRRIRLRSIRGLCGRDCGNGAEEKHQRGALLKEERPAMNEN